MADTYHVKDHVVREVVNRLRDTALEFHAHGSLRERLARELEPLLAASTVPEMGERAAFEKAMNDSRFFPRELDFSRTKSPSGRDEYANSHLQSNWEGWQARAALASRPAEADDSPTDAKRLDWLQGTNQTFCGNYSNTGFRAIGSSIWHGTLREAIDGAMIEAAPSHTTNKEK